MRLFRRSLHSESFIFGYRLGSIDDWANPTNIFDWNMFMENRATIISLQKKRFSNI